jgi:hypothetical protein
MAKNDETIVRFLAIATLNSEIDKARIALAIALDIAHTINQETANLKTGELAATLVCLTECSTALARGMRAAIEGFGGEESNSTEVPLDGGTGYIPNSQGNQCKTEWHNERLPNGYLRCVLTDGHTGSHRYR